ncbi:hypothetical protein KVT40_009217 [Elsinoe batatas]|uniref:Uncharacterized protein n=1 Tax=Elsinoe batatas TaxID=2601811 RepID=A0A8K0KVV0_9PEZI|nr:hypothetical protein KVT40_009217 [Elsinoe batatas]
MTESRTSFNLLQGHNQELKTIVPAHYRRKFGVLKQLKMGQFLSAVQLRSNMRVFKIGYEVGINAQMLFAKAVHAVAKDCLANRRVVVTNYMAKDQIYHGYLSTVVPPSGEVVLALKYRWAERGDFRVVHDLENELRTKLEGTGFALICHTVPEPDDIAYSRLAPQDHSTAAKVSQSDVPNGIERMRLHRHLFSVSRINRMNTAGGPHFGAVED